MEIKELMNHFAQPGHVNWIGVRPERRSDVNVLQQVEAEAGRGLKGDRYNSKNGGRQVTLIQQEHLDAVAAILRLDRVDPALVRRNIVTSGINLIALKGKHFKIGEVLLEYSGECHPCSRMEEQLGYGGYNAMRGHGGITAKIISGGIINLRDSVVPVEDLHLP